MMSATSERWSYNDYVLLGSLAYCSIDLLMEWENFGSCSRPIHKWLLVSYLCVLAFRGVHMAGSYAAGGQDTGGEFLLDLRSKGAWSKLLVAFTWTMALPFFMFWTLLGSSWLWQVVTETPHCVPSQTHLWFSGFWLMVCYGWICIHVGLGVVAFVLERRVQRAEGSLREIEDDDVRQRWGSVSSISDYRELTGDVMPVGKAGLTPAEIKLLPCETASATTLCGHGGQRPECSVCLCDVESTDVVRRLPDCGHCFHKSCIDLWLLRRADCPLCKRAVVVSGSTKQVVAVNSQQGEWV